MKPSTALHLSADRLTGRVCSLRSFAFALSLAAVAACGAHAQAVNVTFENGSADYDNSTGTQTTGVFKDVNGNSSLNLSANGAGNDYLAFSGQASAVYDTSPSGNLDAANAFKIGAGQSAVLTVEAQSTTTDASGRFTVGLWNPTDAGTKNDGNNRGVGLSFYLAANASDQYAYYAMKNTGFDTGANIGSSTFASLNDSANTWFRLVITFTNNATNTGATLSADIYKIDGFGGSVVSTVATDYTQTITYGTGQADTSKINLNPASTGLGLFLFAGQTGTNFYMDNLSFTVIPEPSAAALVAGAAGLLLVARHRRRR